MVFGSSSVNVTIDGSAGRGNVIVPVPAIATARRGMDRSLGIILAVLSLFLIVGAIAIIGASTRESVLLPGERPSSRQKLKARIVMALTGVLFIAATALGNRWWGHEDSRYLRRMYRPIQLSATVLASGGERTLSLAMQDPGWMDRSVTDFVPDHGKLMHLFLIREPAFDAFAHIHPEPAGSTETGNYRVIVPRELPAGTYRLYADVVHADGLAETLTDSVQIIPPAAGLEQTPARAYQTSPGQDPDDSWRVGGKPGKTVDRLDDDSTMTWVRDGGELKSGQLVSLKFSVASPDGTPAALEPYMGMLSHAAIMRDDGTVFIHIHPMGTVPMAAELAFEGRVRQGAAIIEPQPREKGRGADSPPPASRESTMPPMPGMTPGHQGATREADQSGSGPKSGNTAMPPMPGMSGMPGMTMDRNVNSINTISFPYSFPKPGHYYLWVQVKRNGRVLTGVFDADVR
ncbi:MAG TPA: hypothetical protein VJX67_27290 [Blastocatellia bacterium]|nr:hypothetical protein [Blastocatellia bacterium]